MTEAGAKFLKWGLFGVVVSVLPIMWAATALFINGREISFIELLGNGDLLMATCASCAVAQGEVIGSDHMDKGWKISLGFCAFFVVIGACLVFSEVTMMRLSDHIAYEKSLLKLAIVSSILFIAGLVFGGFAVWASER